MTRLKVLLGVLAVGLLVMGVMLLWGDLGSYWTEIATTDQPTARRATAPRAGPRAATTRSASTAEVTTLLRELPRQALLITAAHEFGLPAGDPSVDFSGVTDAPPLGCRLTYDWSRKLARVTVHDARGVEVRTIDLPVPMIEQDYPDYAKLAGAVEPWGETHFAPLLAKALESAAKTADARTTAATATSTTQPAPDDNALPSPAEVAPLLAQVDPQRAFLAAHLLHRAIAESGESPQRLADLVRAYNLGESTRYLYSPHGSTFFARALIYAERLVRKHPNLPLAHAARGYAYTLLGQPMDGRRAIAKARQLAGADVELPTWATLADHLNHFRTRSLFEGIGGDDAPLASYFTLLTVEHSGLQSVVINMSRQALQQNPGALRVINIMNDNSGVSLQHETTARSTAAQFELLAALADEPGAPQAVRDAAAAAKERQSEPPALRELLARMDAEPATAGQLLPWGAYASVARDALFVSGFRRLYFTGQMLAVDPGNRLQSWWPILKDHRFAPVLAGFDRTGKVLGVDNEEAVAALRRISLDDIYKRMPWMVRFMQKRVGATSAPAVAGGDAGAGAGAATMPATAEARRWIDHYPYPEDNTAYDLAHLLWTYKGKEADAIQFLGLIKGEIAKSLNVMCPDHPSALAELIVNRWPETKARAETIERELGGHPQVAYALARAYRAEKRFADAARLLEQVIAISPDPPVYEELAELYKQQGDADKWIAIYEKYLANSEDFGLDHARKNEEIAYTLMRMKKFDRALQYAEAAAASYSGWGLRVHAACLTELGRYAEAERIERANQERYPGSFAWYRWCQTTGRGDLAAARKLSAAQAAEIEASAPHPRQLHDLAIYYQLEAQLDRARDVWQRAFEHDRSAHDALQLTLLDLEQGKEPDLEGWLDRAASGGLPALPPEFAKLMGNITPPADERRAKIYRIVVDEMRRCLDDPKALPRRDDPDVRFILDATGVPARGVAAYAFGRLCELRGKRDEAEWWYRAALDGGDWTAATRPQAAAGLRRLGKEYYK